jgi:hypothetical protein
MKGSELYVIFKIKEQYYGIPAMRVREMVAMPDTRSVPVSADYFRGVINLRSEVLRVVDMRTLFSFISLPRENDELHALLNARERDHLNWIAALETSIQEKTPFTLALDPHKCAFGKWYDSYTTENLVIRQVLKEFDAPHKKIHALAEKVFALMDENRENDAKDMILFARNRELNELIILFKKLRRLLKENLREIGMVILTGKQPYVLTTDSILSVEHLEPQDRREMQEILPGQNAGSNLIAAVSELKHPIQTLVLLLDPKALEALL